MKNLEIVQSSHFGEVATDIYSNGKEMFMTAGQLGECLEFSQAVKSISNLVNRNEYLKGDEFSVVTKLVSTDGKAKHSSKEVPTFRYYKSVIDVIRAAVEAV